MHEPDSHVHNHEHSHDHASSDGHNHEHSHDHDHEHTHDHESDKDYNCVHVELDSHDGATIVSGSVLLLTENADAIRDELRRQLEIVALAVEAADGIIGHIKASLMVESVDMISVTDASQGAQVKSSPVVDAHVNAVAIVFEVSEQDAKNWLRAALDALLDIA